MNLTSILGGGAGNIYRDPSKFPILIINGSDLLIAHASTTTYASDSAIFWLRFDNVGAYASCSDASWETIVNLTSSSGFLLNVVGPKMEGTATINRVRITLDGTAYTIDTAVRSGYRTLMGPTIDTAEIDQYATSNGTEYGTFTGSLTIGHPSSFFAMGYPVLRFESSLKVEVYCDDVDVGAEYDNAGVTYFLES